MAPFEAAKASAELSRQRYGRTAAPFATAISTAVENYNISTMTITSLIAASDWIPRSPHSQYKSYAA